jgi:hypothetical protein
MFRRIWNAITILTLIAIMLTPFFGGINTAKAQVSPYNQPIVAIRESSSYSQVVTPVNNINNPGGTYNLTMVGYINVTNPSDQSALYNVNISYNIPPVPFTISQVAATLYIPPGTVVSKPVANMQTPGIIHINEIPATGTYQVSYVINSTFAYYNTTYGFPTLMNTTERYALESFVSPGTWAQYVNLTYNSSYNAYVNTFKNLHNGDNLSILVTLNNTGSQDITNVNFQKQLPLANNASTGNATFTAYNCTIWSTQSPDPISFGFNPDANNYVNVNVLTPLHAGSTLYIQMNGTLSNITGSQLNATLGTRFLNLSRAYMTYTAQNTSNSYLGSLINNTTFNWISAGGNANFALDKGWNTNVGRWQFAVSVNNPTNITFTETNIKVYRSQFGTSPDYQTAILSPPIYNDSTIRVLDPGQTYQMTAIADTGYLGSEAQPPIYWTTYSWTVNGTAVGSGSNYQQSLLVGGANPGNTTYIEPALLLNIWELYVNKNVTYNTALGAYVINITVQNIGFTDTPSSIRIYDFVPSRFNATSFYKNSLSYIPDYHGAVIVNGPVTIGWNLSALVPGGQQNMSYLAFGNQTEYYPTDLYVIGADPMNIIGAIPGGDTTLTQKIGGLFVGVVMANAVAVILLLGVLRRRK